MILPIEKSDYMKHIKTHKTHYYNGKKILSFEETFDKETKTVYFFIIFEYERKLKLCSYVDKYDKFEKIENINQSDYYINDYIKDIELKIQRLSILIDEIEEPSNKQEFCILQDIINVVKNLKSYINTISVFNDDSKLD
jgi:hypothetical protein